MIEEFQGNYRWLSNFALLDITYDGLIYPSVENAYQAAKTNDLNVREYYTCILPGQAKRYSKDVDIRSDWNNVRVSIMYDLLVQKFKTEPFKSLLLETGNVEIQEGNRWGDTFWGVDLKTGKGQNTLGKLIMSIRSNLQGDYYVS